jgi:hypothetical protein
MLYMSILKEKIRIVKSHDQGGGSIEFCIPKEFQHRYNLSEPTHLILIPEEDSFRVMKLRIQVPGEGN